MATETLASRTELETAELHSGEAPVSVPEGREREGGQSRACNPKTREQRERASKAGGKQKQGNGGREKGEKRGSKRRGEDTVQCAGGRAGAEGQRAARGSGASMAMRPQMWSSPMACDNSAARPRCTSVWLSGPSLDNRPMDGWMACQILGRLLVSVDDFHSLMRVVRTING